jgi:YD repeat-containing protein
VTLKGHLHLETLPPAARTLTTRQGSTLLTYDTENRLNSVTQGGQTTTFTYDADGQQVKQDTVTDTIVYVGSHYEARFEEGDMPQDLDGDCDVDIVMPGLDCGLRK